ncbi:bZIP transcription factor [Microvirga sp. RSM25]|uniref:bZIP transcription factor n=1 Tax=Microvirga sp. RSM25 TaxID=3273802 RepID=UPI00384E2465
MNFWWVNQNQTWQQEIENGYLWSPKSKSNGAYNQFYENMRHVKPGDIVFSYFRQQISFIGIVQQEAVTAAKPSEFGNAGSNWNTEGWLVPVEWHHSPISLYPANYIDELRPTLPDKYSPLQRRTGNGLQCVYLAEVPPEMAKVLLAHLGELGQQILDPSNAQNTEDELDISAEEMTLLDDFDLTEDENSSLDQELLARSDTSPEESFAASLSQSSAVRVEEPVIRLSEYHAERIEQLEQINELERANEHLRRRIEDLLRENQVLRQQASAKADIIPQLRGSLMNFWRRVSG